jgi:uncharacterized protein (TIGR03083 family)
VSEWNFMDPQSRKNVLRVIQEEADQFMALASASESWEAATGAGHWQVRDVVGHLVDTTEEYFVCFDAARGRGEAKDPLGLPGMAGFVDEGAQAFRSVPQPELLERLRVDLDKMLGIFNELSDEEWAGFMVPHKFMGPLPASFYAIFQVVDYAMHGWDIREGTGRAHALSADAADLLVPLSFILWQNTAQVKDEDEPYSIGVRVTSGHNAGDTRLDVSAAGVTYESASVEGLPAVLDFDAASCILTAYGRMNGGALSGDRAIGEHFLNLYFRI